MSLPYFEMFLDKNSPVGQHSIVQVKSITIEAVITRADGTVEDLGVISRR